MKRLLAFERSLDSNGSPLWGTALVDVTIEAEKFLNDILLIL